MAVTLKVSTDQLKSKANQIQTQITTFESNFKQIAQVVSNTKGYWVGDASTSHQRQFDVYEQDVLRIVKRLREHPDDLLKMANVYEEGEKAAQQVAQALPVDVIF